MHCARILLLSCWFACGFLRAAAIVGQRTARLLVAGASICFIVPGGDQVPPPYPILDVHVPERL